jgi:ABC-2 type transport system ATP-binding protein
MHRSWFAEAVLMRSVRMASWPSAHPLVFWGTDMSAPIVQLLGLRKTYGSFEAVAGMDLVVPAGSLFALLGPNGAGKTTTIRMLMGILQPSAGLARIGGRDCFRERVEVMRLVGYVPDEPVFYDYLRGSEIIRFVGEMHGLSRGVIEERSGPLVERLQLGDATNEYAVNYSRGMKKKLALISAMLHDPQLLILDEPTNGLDPFATRTLHELMQEQVQRGKTVFFSTHLLDQAEKICDRIAIVARGKLAAEGTLEDLRGQRSQDASLESIFFSVAAQAESSTAGPEGKVVS